MTADIHFSCLERSKTVITGHDASEIHISIIDPESPLRNLLNFHLCLMDVFVDTPPYMILHDRTYVARNCQHNTVS